MRKGIVIVVDRGERGSCFRGHRKQGGDVFVDGGRLPGRGEGIHAKDTGKGGVGLRSWRRRGKSSRPSSYLEAWERGGERLLSVN